ncbi:MAG TPA: 5'-3' exonuclease H3TH domain-containing protein [Jatrophihabitans sp.]|uniref:5'-3' exonuclease n=1 Tax=Jatrophihabitans sp. TaxID=1932789 RepID=UPI002EF1E211
MQDSPVLLAVDGNSLVHRSFHSQAGTGLRAADGRPLWAIRGLLTQLVAAAERICPTAILVGFDDPVASVRRTRWPQYKASRTEKLQNLVSQLDGAAEVLRRMGVAVVVPEGLEADDVLASAARLAPQVGARTVIMTSDRDSFALIDEHTRVLRIINGGVDASPLLTPQLLAVMLGIRPEQYCDYAALRGDPSDNLPGVRGIGPKTAARLLTTLGTAAAVFDDLAAGGARVRAAVGSAAAKRLAQPEARTAWELNCQVMRMHCDVELGLDLSDISGGPGMLPLDPAAVGAAFRDHELTWTTPAALQFLAYQNPPERPVEQAWSSERTGWSSEPPDLSGAESPRRPAPSGGRTAGAARTPSEHGRPGGRRFGKLAKHASQPKDAAVQLSLFD